MKKHNKNIAVYISAVAVSFLLFCTVTFSVFAEYDEYGNYYDPYEEYDQDIVTDSYYVNSSDDNPGLGYYYDAQGNIHYGETSPPTQEPTSENSSVQPLDISGTSVDTSELTSDDWADVQASLSSTFRMNPSKVTDEDGEDFKDIKKTESTDMASQTNDVWIYLMAGIGLIIAGVILIFVLMVTTARTKRKLRLKAAKYSQRNDMVDIVSDEYFNQNSSGHSL